MFCLFAESSLSVKKMRFLFFCYKFILAKKEENNASNEKFNDEKKVRRLQMNERRAKVCIFTQPVFDSNVYRQSQNER